MTGKIEKLIIGTAQWGLDYGISNNNGKTGKCEVENILKTAKNHGINTLDTASAYGDAEKIIGELKKEDSKIITKISIGNQDKDVKQSRDDIHNKVMRSFSNLGKFVLEGVLVHDPGNLESCKYSWSWDALKDIKEEGYMKKIGISVYNPSQAEKLAEMYKPDIIQLPFNAFDKKAADLGTLKRLKDEGIEIHARSLFLQGLLLMNIKDISKYFTPWMSEIERWHEYCITNRLTLLEGAIANAMREESIDKFIVGIEDTRQLIQIIDASKRQVRNGFKSCQSEGNEGLINPSEWRIGK